MYPLRGATTMVCNTGSIRQDGAYLYPLDKKALNT